MTVAPKLEANPSAAILPVNGKILSVYKICTRVHARVQKSITVFDIGYVGSSWLLTSHFCPPLRKRWIRYLPFLDCSACC